MPTCDDVLDNEPGRVLDLVLQSCPNNDSKEVILTAMWLIN